MSNGLDRDPLFVALTRPQMFAGVTYTFFVINGVVSTEFFLIFKSAWVLLLALVIHAAGVIACLKEPRIFDLQLVRALRCPRVRNYRFWQCNSYRA
jgi:type IV secretion system protein VirB3